MSYGQAAIRAPAATCHPHRCRQCGVCLAYGCSACGAPPTVYCAGFDTSPHGGVHAERLAAARQGKH